MVQTLIVWMVTLMAMLSPPHRVHYEPAAQESHAQADARYREIATAIVNKSYDPNIEPIFKGPKGRLRTALFVALTFYWESGYRRDVDLGIDRRRLARTGWNDFGRSWCMGQINLGRKPRPDPDNPGQMIEESASVTPEGWTGRDLVGDREKCVEATIRVLRQSFGACKHLPANERYALYTSGTCDNERGKAMSRNRVAQYWSKAGLLPNISDDDVLKELQNLPTVADTSLAADTR